MVQVLERIDGNTPGGLSAATRWHLPGELRALLDEDGRLPFDEWQASGSARKVKHDQHRTVWHVQFASIDVYIKEYRTIGPRGKLRELIRPVKAKAEFERAKCVVARGVATPIPLGWGFAGPAWMPDASWVLTATVSGARPLIEELVDRTSAHRQALAIALGSFVAKVHAAGVVHHDLHPGNLLVRWLDDRAELFLIDLHLARLGRPLSWRQRRQNLCVFNRFFILRATRADRLRFWRAYEAAAADAIPDHREATATALEDRSWESNIAFWKARERRYCSNNRAFGQVQGGSVSGWALRSAVVGLEDSTHPTKPGFVGCVESSRPTIRLLDNPDALLTSGESLKAGGASTVAAHDGVVVKRFNIRSFVELLKNLVRPSAGLRSWVMGHGLLDAGLPTARPLAFVQRRRWGCPATGYLLAERLDGMEEAHRFAERLLLLPEAERRAITRVRIDAVARVIRQFHERGFGHHDLKAANLLTPIAAHDHRVFFIDLVGVYRRRRRVEAGPPEGLRRLAVSFINHPAVSRSDRLRFLRTYMDWSTRGGWGWKTWWRQVGEAAQAKQARNARLGRPLA